jgi:hypothetical protein
MQAMRAKHQEPIASRRPERAAMLGKEMLSMCKPTRLLDPGFKYVPARHTNIAKTFARDRREQARACASAVAKATVIPINKERNHA